MRDLSIRERNQQDIAIELAHKHIADKLHFTCHGIQHYIIKSDDTQNILASLHFH